MKKVSLIIIGLILGVLISFSVVYGKEASQGIEVFYRNIKLFVDGGEVVPKDANGNLVEPFIYNGTTYLPVRAVAEALDKDVKWDGKNATVYIGKEGENEPDNYLDRIQYNDFSKGNNSGNIEIIKSPIEDVDGSEYTNGILLFTGGNNYDNGSFWVNVYYPLNGQYSKMNGNVVLPKNKNVTKTDIEIYGDGELLYKAKNVVYSMPFKFDIDVSGINQLNIKVKNPYNGYKGSYTALTNLALYE